MGFRSLEGDLHVIEKRGMVRKMVI